jgi:putative SOS response-associated peptidase YedK
MCGRFTQTTPVEQLAEQFQAVVAIEEPPTPNYNVAPTQDVVGIVQPETGPRELHLFHWGLIPFWAKDPAIGNRMINARAETLAEKPAFRTALEKRRCLVLADGFYEWQKTSTGKVPMYIYRLDGRPLAFAGLWERWQSPGGDLLHSCTVITVPPNDLMAPIHDRMPAILPDEALDPWLDPERHAREEALKLLAPFPAELLTAHPVSSFVNNPRNQGAACIAPLGQ